MSEPLPTRLSYKEIIECRRRLSIEGYSTLAQAGLDGTYVTPLQISSCSPDGPVLVAHHWFDFQSAVENREILKERGYMPGIPFNDVIDMALGISGMQRSEIYMTQAFHLLPGERREPIPARHVNSSFQKVTQHELFGRYVIALGGPAARVCHRHRIEFQETIHPSAPRLTYEFKARHLAKLLILFRTSKKPRHP